MSVCEQAGEEHERTSLVSQGDSDKGREKLRTKIVGSCDVLSGGLFSLIENKMMAADSRKTKIW